MVLQVIAYSAVFGSGVKEADLARFQTGTSIFTEQELRAAARNLRQKGVITTVPLPVSPPLLQQKWHSAARAVQFLQRFPSIESIWVTGGLAVGNIQPDDDIDLMIITADNSLWLTRTLVAVNDLRLRRIRRRGDHDQQLKDKWCCNLWLESGALQLTPDQRSLYSAREVIQAVPVFQRRQGAAEKFLRANSWVQEYLPVGFQQGVKRAENLPVAPSARATFSLPLLNQFFFWLQSQRMRRYLRHEIVEHRRAFFHPGERAKDVQAKYEKILELVFFRT